MQRSFRFALLSTVLLVLGLLIGPAGAQEAPDSPEVAACLPGAGYTSGCDVDQDGDIDIFDIQLTAGRWNSSGVYTAGHTHWGETWTGAAGPQGLRVEHTGTTGSVSAVAGQNASTTGAGVYGFASASSGANYGVYGRSDSAGGYGVYAEGNAHVAGQLTWQAITSYVSIPPAAFTPADEAYQFAQLGQKLTPNNSSSSTYYAPVSLPHGATATRLTFYWRDTDAASNVIIELDRSAFNGFVSTMASAASTGSGGDGSSTDSTIASATVNNSQYEYIVGLTLPSASTSLYGVVIEYTLDRPY